MIEIRCDERWEELINKSGLQKIITIFLKHLFEGERGISIFLANDRVIRKLNKTFLESSKTVYYTHLTLPTKRIV